jgi:hypothetical protein
VRSELLLSALLVTSPIYAGGAADELLSRDPIKEAERAFANGDRRHIVVPTCDGGEVLPGWPLHESPEALDAIAKGRRPVTCADMAPDPRRHVFIKVGKYAERYNRRLLELSKPRTR